MAEEFDRNYSLSNFMLLANAQNFHGVKGRFGHTRSHDHLCVNQPAVAYKRDLNYLYYGNASRQKMLMLKSNPNVAQSEKDEATKLYETQRKFDLAKKLKTEEEAKKTRQKLQKTILLKKMGSKLGMKIGDKQKEIIRIEK